MSRHFSGLFLSQAALGRKSAIPGRAGDAHIIVGVFDSAAIQLAGGCGAGEANAVPIPNCKILPEFVRKS